MKRCMAIPDHAVDPSCSVVMVDHNATATGELSESGWDLEFKTAIDPSCTLDRAVSGLCSACSAAALLAGKCPPGIHTIVTNVVSPGGLMSDTSLTVTLYVGTALLSTEVMARYEVLSNTEGMDRPSHASARLQQMLILTQVLCCCN